MGTERPQIGRLGPRGEWAAQLPERTQTFTVPERPRSRALFPRHTDDGLTSRIAAGANGFRLKATLSIHDSQPRSGVAI